MRKPCVGQVGMSVELETDCLEFLDDHLLELHELLVVRSSKEQEDTVSVDQPGVRPTRLVAVPESLVAVVHEVLGFRVCATREGLLVERELDVPVVRAEVGDDRHPADFNGAEWWHLDAPSLQRLM